MVEFHTAAEDPDGPPPAPGRRRRSPQGGRRRSGSKDIRVINTRKNAENTRKKGRGDGSRKNRRA